MSDEANCHAAAAGESGSSGMSKSMHDRVAVWCDCCSCEAEPYWATLAEETGADPGDDEEPEPGGASGHP